MTGSSRILVLYPWFEEHGPQMIHPDDLSSFRKLQPYGLVFEQVTVDRDFHTLSYGSTHYRVKPDLIKPILPRPDKVFELGDLVDILGVDHVGTVILRSWHHTKRRIFYNLRINDKTSGKRYWAEDLAPLRTET